MGNLATVPYNLYSRFGWGILGGPGLRYQLLDKALDTYYMVFALVVVSKWTTTLKISSYVLFASRLAGVVLLFLLKNEIVLVIFPNFFETFFLSVLILRLDKRQNVHPAMLLFLFAVAIFQKMFQEYALHVLPIRYLTILKEIVTAGVSIVFFSLYYQLRGVTTS